MVAEPMVRIRLLVNLTLLASRAHSPWRSAAWVRQPVDGNSNDRPRTVTPETPWTQPIGPSVSVLGARMVAVPLDAFRTVRPLRAPLIPNVPVYVPGHTSTTSFLSDLLIALWTVVEAVR